MSMRLARSATAATSSVGRSSSCKGARVLSTSCARAINTPATESTRAAGIASRQSQIRSISSTPSNDVSATPLANPKGAERPEPASTFQQSPEPSPIPIRSADLDHSFVGMSGGEIFHEMMLRHQVKHVFGYPGGAILPVFDAIHNSKHFQFILPRREDGAGHMAEGYARVTGKPGVVLVTSGPGATNVITPMQDAMSDGTPLVVFCGQVATSAIGSDAFQEADVVGISRSCTKWNVMVKNIAELPRRINEAFKIATSGRPGPVLVDLPKDVTAGILRQALPYSQTHPSLAALPSRATARSSRSRAIRHQSQPAGPGSLPDEAPEIAEAARLINGAKRPVIYAGAGMLSTPQGPELLKELSERAGIPVTTTLQGLGAFDELHPLSLHMLGMHGSAYANLAMQEADVIIALGARFDDRVTGRVDKFAPQARAAALEGRGGIIHFEIMPKNINKVVQATCALEGDVIANLAKVLPQVEQKTHPKWHARIADWKQRFPFTYYPSDPSKGEFPKPQEVIEELDRAIEPRKEKTIISTGVGQHQMWAAQHIRWRHPRSWVSSGGLGTMGFGVPSSVGAKVARPDCTVVCVDGDASFSMTAMELATANEFNVGVKILVLNNEFQGMVLQWQDLFYEQRYSGTRMTNPDFCKLASAMGCHTIHCDSLTDLPAKMKEFIEYDNDRPVLFECRVVTAEHCYPMIAAGSALHEMTMHPSLVEGFKSIKPANA
ncbi:acetolactate synthase [Ceraceosorus bombacis]|uniref:Acetolactate synthase n=1 Tax=Ceraceosorus bombacis TaxID=401625 RepID=A0A0P1BCY4_9BASI|nr:acetolactate synthase [Ceraceosorus bombacis]